MGAYMDKVEYNRRWRQKIRLEAEKLLGDKCFFCSRNKNLTYHEIRGRKHRHDVTAMFVVKNPGDFVRLCHPCHRAVHWMMEKFEWMWEDINKHLK